MTASTRGSESDGGKRRLVGCAGGRAEQVDRIRDARFARQHGGECVPCLVAQLRQLESGSLARVGAEDPESARVRDDSDRAALGQRLRGQERRGIEELAEPVRADNARLLEKCVHGLLRAGKGGGVRARRPRSGATAATLHRKHGLAACHATRDAPEAPRVSERLEVEQDHLGGRIVLPVLEQVV